MSPSKEESASSSAAPKIAIKGFSLSSKSGTSSKSKHSSSTLGKRPRSNFQAAQDDSEDEDDRDHRRGKQEAVTGFGAEGAISKREEKEKSILVIPKQANRDWKSEARARRGGGGKNLLPKEVQAQRRGETEGKKEGVDVVNSGEGEIEWGLSLRKRVKVEENGEVGGTIKIEEEVETIKAEVKKERTADEEAISALLGEKKKRTGPDLVISSEGGHLEVPEHVSELDAYKRAVALAPDVSTLEDYERVPVEEFGAALLRGMGWKGEKRGGVKEVKRRQNLLGLGAKELKDAEELGAWVQKSDVKRLNGPGGGDRRPERKPKASEYRREEERRRERREERGGGGYRREKERERESEGSGRDYRHSGRDSGRDSGWERDRRR